MPSWGTDMSAHMVVANNVPSTTKTIMVAGSPHLMYICGLRALMLENYKIMVMVIVGTPWFRCRPLANLEKQ